MTAKTKIETILSPKFSKKHIASMLKHFQEALNKYASNDWEGVGLKAGKFVEAIAKVFLVFTSQPIPPVRQFKAGTSLKSLEQLPSAQYSDVVRIVIPKACIYIYEIANNRGSRHDPGDISPNEIDAKVLIPIMSWIVAEMIRFVSANSNDTENIELLMQELVEKSYPVFEQIGERVYINQPNLSALNLGILILYFKYPSRVNRSTLADSIIRHGHTKGAAMTAVSRLTRLVDDEEGNFKLRGLGRLEAEGILKSLA